MRKSCSKKNRPAAASRWLLVQREPFRLFFPLGILLGMLGTGHWLVYGMGLSPGYSGYYHAALQAWLYMGCFVSGFLMTAIPRFASAPHARPAEIFGVLAAMAFIFGCLLAKAFVAAAAGYGIWLMLLLAFIARRFLSKGEGANPPKEFVWIPAAFLLALAGTAILILSQCQILPVTFIRAGRSMTEQGFVLFLVMGIGGFLGPRLMGALREPRRNALILHAAAGALLAGSYLLEAWEPLRRTGFFLRAFVVLADMGLISRVLLFPKKSTLFQRLLSLSFWLVPAGLWAAAIFPKQAVTMLHVLFLGGFSLMIFLVATMVVLSHTGAADQIAKPLWIYRVIAAGVFTALFIRLTAHWAPQSYFLHLGIASAFWILTGAAWLAFAMPHLWRLTSGAEFDRDHEKFKKNIHHAC